MDDGFNLPQGQYVMSQTPMRPKKKKTGLIVGISVAVAALLAVLSIFVFGGSDIEGTWTYTERGMLVEVDFNGDATGAVRTIVSGTTISDAEFKYKFDDYSMVLTIQLDKSYGDSEKVKFKVTKLTSDTMVWEQDGVITELKKVD